MLSVITVARTAAPISLRAGGEARPAPAHQRALFSRKTKLPARRQQFHASDCPHPSSSLLPSSTGSYSGGASGGAGASHAVAGSGEDNV